MTLMTCHSSMKWMSEQGILKHWIFPENGLNEGTNYAHHLVGSSPELMPLDCSLFQYVILGLRNNIIYTSTLDKDDPKSSSFLQLTMLSLLSIY